MREVRLGEVRKVTENEGGEVGGLRKHKRRESRISKEITKKEGT